MFSQLKARKADLEKQIESATATLHGLSSQIASEQQRLTELRSAIRTTSNIITYQEMGMIYECPHECADDLEFTLQSIRNELADLSVSDNIMLQTRQYRIDGSESKGRKFQKDYTDNLVIGLGAYITSKQKSVTAANYNKTVELIKKAFEKYQKRCAIIGIKINPQFITLKLKETEAILNVKLAKEKKRKELQEKRRRLKEQEQILAEAAKERKRLEEERKAMDIAFAKALTDNERAAIKEQMETVDKRIQDVDYRCTHQKAGWVYLITSPSLPGMYKCGVTRRQSPFTRVKELSSSSLPFPFEIQAYCFADDAFDIESKMHQYFDAIRVSPDREFFNGDVNKAIRALRDVFGQEIHYAEDVLEKSENST